ncbi:MAG TPA: tetratricopeptide repeat protein [Patescibacteria group bacterium]|nr:tetratricopeptide repeat protein [Patescibacteria group bacterium]
MNSWARTGIFLFIALLLVVQSGVIPATATVLAAAAPAEMLVRFDAEFKYNQESGESLSGAQARLMLGAQLLAAERAALLLESRPELSGRKWSKDELQALGLAATEIQVVEKKNRSENMVVKFQGALHLNRVKILADDRQTLGLWQRFLADNRQLLTQMKTLRQKWETASESQQQALRKEMVMNDRRASANEWYEQGNRYNEKREFDKAIECYNRALLLNERFVDGLIQRGDAYDNKGSYDEAIADYSQALELDPQQLFVYNNRGVAYRHKGNFDAAMADYKQALTLDSNCGDVYSNRAAAYNSQGQYDQAIADASQALRLNSRDVDAYNNRSVAYISKGQYESAIADCEQVLNLDPQYAYAYYNKAVALERAGRKLEATEAYRSFLHYAPIDDPLTRTVKQYLQKGNE